MKLMLPLVTRTQLPPVLCDVGLPVIEVKMDKNVVMECVRVIFKHNVREYIVEIYSKVPL